MVRVEEKNMSSSWMVLIRFLLGGCGSSKDLATARNDSKKKIGMPMESRLSFKDFDDFDSPEYLSISLVVSNLYIFTLQELKLATNNFSKRKLIGEGGFGAVYKGHVDEKLRPTLKPQDVAIKLLDLTGCQGHREWLTEVVFLGQLKHNHLVTLIGYCYENQHRLLVYEYMSGGSLEDHLFLGDSILGWRKRMKIAVEAAKGLEFLHEADHPVIYRDFKASNVLLDSDYNVKLSDFGLAKDGPLGDETHVSTRVMGTQGYAAPEYIMTGHLTTKSDVFAFGVVLLELLTGMRSFDSSRSGKKKSLVDWAKPYLKEDPSRFCRVVDPRLEGKYSSKAVETVVKLTRLCLSHNPKDRPQMGTIVDTLERIKDLDNDDIQEETMFVGDTKSPDNTANVNHNHHWNPPNARTYCDTTLHRKIWTGKR